MSLKNKYVLYSPADVKESLDDPESSGEAKGLLYAEITLLDAVLRPITDIDGIGDVAIDTDQRLAILHQVERVKQLGALVAMQ